jgi:hypothetical protein
MHNTLFSSQHMNGLNAQRRNTQHSDTKLNDTQHNC